MAAAAQNVVNMAQAGTMGSTSPEAGAAVDGIVGRLGRMAVQQVSLRVDIEADWLEDLRQYQGMYEPRIAAALRDAEQSEMFANTTRWRTNAWAARIGDMMFPTDDKNYGIGATPNPKLADAARVAAEAATKAADSATQAQGQGGPGAAQGHVAAGNAAASVAASAQATIDEAKKRVRNMEATIDDQFVECRFNVISREAIADMCKLGPAVLKGPLVSNRLKRTWTQTAATDTEKGYWSMQPKPDPAPESKRVSPWAYFPELGAASFDDRSFEFERHLPNKEQLRKYKGLPGFDAAAINALLVEEPTESVPNYLNQLRSLGVVEQGVGIAKRYIAWEYSGPVTRSEMIDLIGSKIIGASDEAEANAHGAWLSGVLESDDDEFKVIIWFCQGKLLKFADWPNDDGSSIYDMCTFMESETSVYGNGVPRLLRDPQTAVNSGWRMMLDNGALSTGPQIIIDKSMVSPENGKWKLTPRKIWTMIKTIVTGAQAPFQAFNITNNQAELAAIVKLAREFADEEASLPQIAQGEQGEHVTPTAQGMSMLMGSANVVFRWVIRKWDDKITTKHVTRYYDWNMAHSPDDGIKGDMQVDARGTSVLLAKEATAGTLIGIAERWTVHPVLGSKVKALPAARAALKALSIPADEILMSDEEAAAVDAAKAQQPPPKSPQEITAAAQVQRATIDAGSREKVAEISQQVAMEKLAAQYNMHVDQLKALLDNTQATTDSKERIVAANIAVDQSKTAAAAAGVRGAEGGGKGIE